jgi:hypothetical protein
MCQRTSAADAGSAGVGSSTLVLKERDPTKMA